MCHMKNLKKTIVTIFQKSVPYEKFEKNYSNNFSKTIVIKTVLSNFIQ